MNEVFTFDQCEPVVCPDCGSECELSSPDGGVAECHGCSIAFNFKIEENKFGAKDTFLTQDTCDRCPNPLQTRTMSWFNEDTICMECSGKERAIKTALRAKGITNAMEGCGYVPNPEEVK